MTRISKLLASLWVPAFLATACSLDGLLDANAPSRVPSGSLTDPANAQLMVTSAVADFECAFTNYATAGGLITEELADGNLNAGMTHYDRRTFTRTGGLFATSTCDAVLPGVYQPLSTARYDADNALRILDAASDAAVSNRAVLLATAAAYSGYSHLLLGEGMCSAAVDGGPELTSAQMFALAEQKFTRAIGQTGAPTDIINLARVGRARARIDQGKTQEAAADALLVPAGFRKNATFSIAADRASNLIWIMNQRGILVTVEDPFRNVLHMGVPDPRVRVTNTGLVSQDRVTPLWLQTKYPAQDTPMPIARYEEAQLIIAEVQGGQAAVDIINKLHTAAGLPLFSSTDQGAIRDHLIEERRLELFLESHFLYDKIRFNRPFTPAAGTPYPPKSGGFYGTTTCLPLPDVERDNNPNIP